MLLPMPCPISLPNSLPISPLPLSLCVPSAPLQLLPPLKPHVLQRSLPRLHLPPFSSLSLFLSPPLPSPPLPSITPLVSTPLSTHQAMEIENGVFLGPVGCLTFQGPMGFTARRLAFTFHTLTLKLGPLPPFQVSCRPSRSACRPSRSAAALPGQPAALPVRSLVARAQHAQRSSAPSCPARTTSAKGLVFLLSPLGMHSRNLHSDPGWSGLANARATIFGDLCSCRPASSGPHVTSRSPSFPPLLQPTPHRSGRGASIYAKRHQDGAAQQHTSALLAALRALMCNTHYK
ncbi:unnamed protein product [Closterium sp. Yama58-4]|nr:unnamed protein product [Closterium sp. Yama58-4]